MKPLSLSPLGGYVLFTFISYVLAFIVGLDRYYTQILCGIVVLTVWYYVPHRVIN